MHTGSELNDAGFVRCKLWLGGAPQLPGSAVLAVIALWSCPSRQRFAADGSSLTSPRTCPKALKFRSCLWILVTGSMTRIGPLYIEH